MYLSLCIFMSVWFACDIVSVCQCVCVCVFVHVVYRCVCHFDSHFACTCVCLCVLFCVIVFVCIIVFVCESLWGWYVTFLTQTYTQLLCLTMLVSVYVWQCLCQWNSVNLCVNVCVIMCHCVCHCYMSLCVSVCKCVSMYVTDNTNEFQIYTNIQRHSHNSLIIVCMYVFS